MTAPRFSRGATLCIDPGDRFLNWSAIIRVSTLLIAALLAVGCASTPTPSGGAKYDPNKPRIFLPNANVEQAKGVAMGSAVSKGWVLAQSNGDTLILQRDLNAAAAESIAPGAGLAPLPPVLEVHSSFFPRQGGVDVVLDAQVITGRGTDKQKRNDFTESFRPELMRSLAALRKAWNDSGWRVASAIPPLTTPEPLPDDALDLDAPASVTDGADSVVEVPASEVETQSSPSRVQSAWGIAASPNQSGSVPVEERSYARSIAQPSEAIGPPPGQPAPASTTGEAASNMIALNQPRDTGVWAYYAEHYARVRGCTLTESGANLVEKQQFSETHRIDCIDGKSFLVRCNAGDCRGLR